MAVFLRKYNVLTVTGTTAIRIPMIKRGVVDFAVGADWTPASGDVKIAIDGAAAANVTNLPTAVAMGNTAYWEFILTAAELTCKSSVVTIADSATKAVEDQAFIVETFGNASAMYQADLSAANLPANATQFAGQTITAGAGVTIPSSIASPTNITAATGITVATNSDKTGYSLTQSFPSNFSSLGITAGGHITTVDTLTNAPSDSTGVTTLLSRIGGAITITSGGVLVHSVDTGGIAAASFAAAAITATVAPNLDAAVSSRMATYSQPTGFLAATFPSGTIAKAGDQMALTAAAFDTIIIESGIVASAALTDDSGTQLTSINARQALALKTSGIAGVLAGAATTDVTVKPAGKPSGNTRIDATVDTNGNRSAITLKVPT